MDGRQTRARIVVYQLGSIGDTVVSIPALKAVRRNYGAEVEIVLLHETRPDVNTTPADLLAGGGEVDRFICYRYKSDPWGKLKSAARLWWQLRGHHFEVVIYLAPSERSLARVKRDEFFFRLCGIRRRVGFHAFARECLYPVDPEGRPARVRHEALCRLDRLRMDGIDVSVESDVSRPFLNLPARDVKAAEEWLGARRRRGERALAGICPGAKQPANWWPIERFIEIGRRLVAQERFELLVVGGPAERSIGEQMVAAWGEGLNAAGQFTVLGSAALLGQCSFVVGLDTGTTHLAAAMAVPCVALYGGRENPGRFEPLGQRHIVLRHPVPCANCRLVMKPCPVEGHPCMTGIDVNTVWQAIQHVENRQGATTEAVFLKLGSSDVSN